MPRPFFPNSYTLIDATAKRAAYALSVVRLFKSGFVPDADTVIADLEAEECDYTTYAPETITAWLPPVSATGGGNKITNPTVQFEIAADAAVPNSVGGYWIELAAGDVVLIRQFDEAAPMVEAGDSVQVTATVIIPNGT